MVYTQTEIATKLKPIFDQYGVRTAILFGSYAKGLATSRSDIDLLVDSGLRGLAFYGLLESVSSVLDVPVDMIDVTQLEKGSRIETDIRKSGVQIFGQ